jgi:pyruvate formate lyase activating enzyme
MSALNPFYKRRGDKIECQLCRHYCNLKENQIGICGVNKNEDGKLVNLVYGKVSALNIDPVEKKPLYHFLPGSKALSIGSIGCNFRCDFCQNWQISQSKDLSNLSSISPQEIVDIALKYGCKSIAYTYNEPTIFYPFAKDIAQIAKRYNIKNIFVSNGYESPEVIEDMVGVIDAFNIDIKSFQNSYYKKRLKGDLEGVLDTLKRIKSKNFWLECTTLIVPNDNDSQDELRAIANFIANELGSDTPWHLSAFYPNYKAIDKEPTELATLKRAFDIAKEAGIEYVYLGNVPEDGTTYCPKCNSELICRVGYNVVKNNLIDRRCPNCNKEIAGVWR